MPWPDARYLMTMSLQTMSSWDRTRGLLLNGRQVSTLSRTHWGIQGGAVDGRQRQRLGREELAWLQDLCRRICSKPPAGTPKRLRRRADPFPLPSLPRPNETMGTRGTRGTQIFGLRNQAVRTGGKRGKSRLGALFAKPAGEPAAELDTRMLARRRGTEPDHPLRPPEVRRELGPKEPAWP